MFIAQGQNFAVGKCLFPGLPIKKLPIPRTNKKYNKGSMNLTHPYMLTSTKITVGLEGTAVKGGVLIFYGCCNKLP